MTVKMYRNTKKLLETTRLSISEIAEQVGYLNQSKFATVCQADIRNPLRYLLIIK